MSISPTFLVICNNIDDVKSLLKAHFDITDLTSNAIIVSGHELSSTTLNGMLPAIGVPVFFMEVAVGDIRKVG